MFSRLFDDATIENPSEERRVILAILAVITVVLVVLPAIGSVREIQRPLLYSMGAISALCFVLAYRGSLMVGKVVIPIILNAGSAYLVYSGGIRDDAFFSIAGVIIISSLMLGRNGALFSGIFLTAATIAIGAAEITGLLKTPFASTIELSDVITLAFLVLGTTLVQRILLGRLYHAAQTAKSKENAQVDANRELRALQLDLEQKVAERTSQLRASNEVGQVASAILDPDELIGKVVNLITEEFKYYYAAIFIVEDNGRWAILRDATGSAGQILKARRHRLQVGGNSMVGAAISTKEAHIALDVGETAVRFNNPLLPNTRSEIALPLIVGSRVIGALDVQSTREADFRREDISTLQSMANQVAIALENARLFKEMNDSLEELGQSNREYIMAAWEDRIRAGALEHTVQQPQNGINADVQTINLPLSLRDQPIGDMSIETENEWTSEDQAWVEALATQIAVSLENARLLEESQQSALRERLSASIIQKIWASASLESILQTAVQEMGRALDATEVSIELKVEE